jgi:hypothetical protein
MDASIFMPMDRKFVGRCNKGRCPCHNMQSFFSAICFYADGSNNFMRGIGRPKIILVVHKIANGGNNCDRILPFLLLAHRAIPSI